MMMEFSNLYRYFTSNTDEQSEEFTNAYDELCEFLYNYCNTELVKRKKYRNYQFDLDDVQLTRNRIRCLIYPFNRNIQEDDWELDINFPSWSLSSEAEFTEFLEDRLKSYFI